MAKRLYFAEGLPIINVNCEHNFLVLHDRSINDTIQKRTSVALVEKSRNCISSITPCLKTLFLVTVTIVLIVGCTKSDERIFSGEAERELRSTYQLTLKGNGTDSALYTLEIKPESLENYYKKIRERWHENSKLKFAAYSKMKDYCERTRIEEVCINLDQISKEIATSTVRVSYIVKLFDRKGADLGKFVNFLDYDPNHESQSLKSLPAVTGSFSITEEHLKKVNSIDVIVAFQ